MTKNQITKKYSVFIIPSWPVNHQRVRDEPLLLQGLIRSDVEPVLETFCRLFLGC
jgi:hypothetical protein